MSEFKMSQMSDAAAAGAVGAVAALRGRKRARGSSKSRSSSAYIARGGVASMGFAFPTRYSTKLKYVDEFKMVTASSSGAWLFRANSLFDPDYTGTGHQPRGFDQLCSANGPYNRYVVTGVTWKFRVAGTTDGIVCINNQDNVTPLTPLTQLEQRSSSPAYYCPYVLSGGTPPLMKFKTNIAKEAGVTLSMLRGSDKYMAAYNAGPTEIQTVCVGWSSYDAATLGSVYLWVEAVFSCEFFDVTVLPSS